MDFVGSCLEPNVDMLMWEAEGILVPDSYDLLGKVRKEEEKASFDRNGGGWIWGGLRWRRSQFVRSIHVRSRMVVSTKEHLRIKGIILLFQMEFEMEL